MSVLFPLDLLPLEIVETIAQFLTTKDLAACAATSRGWREKFNVDILWRPHCGLDLEHQYLESTPCFVEPGFVNPNELNTTLTPICKWRLAYMRETRLYNNWRTGKHKEQIVDNGGKYMTLQFLTNDLVVVLFINKLELWDVKNTTAVLTETFYFRQQKMFTSNTMAVINNIVIIVCLNFVQVFHLDLTTSHLFLRHVFYLEEAEKVSFTRSESFRRGFTHCMYNVKGTIFVGSVLDEKLHIWDVETGLKIKEVMCTPKGGRVVSFKLCKENNIVMHTLVNNVNIFIVLSLSSFTFLPFRQIFPGGVKMSGACNKYVAIFNESDIKFYNYETSALVLAMPGPGQNYLRVLNDNLVFSKRDGELVMFNTSTERIQTLGRAHFFYVSCERYLCIFKDTDNLEIIDLCYKNKKNYLSLVLEHVYEEKNFSINKARTICTFIKSGLNTIYVRRLW